MALARSFIRGEMIARFLRHEAAGGRLLIIAAMLALIVANSPLAPIYTDVLHRHVAGLSIIHWINDGLMSLFFLLVGLEVKREFVAGQLASWSARGLPIVAAFCGMVVPALIYLGIAGADPALVRGWAIPTATDIAFSLGVLGLLGSRVPVSLKLMLVTVAIVDDIGAVILIALVYTAGIDFAALEVAGTLLAAMIMLNRRGVGALAPYLLLGGLLWTAVFVSGVHPTVAGVLTAMTIPLRGARSSAPLERLEHGLHPYVAFAVVPLFGFANAGVSLVGLSLDTMLAPLPLALVAGLFIGKQAGIFGGIRLAVALGIGERPDGAGWGQVYGVALLSGIGFTMSLFIGALAFNDPALLVEVKIGVLGGSLLSAVAGYCVLRACGRDGDHIQAAS
ncbi:Na+/H+ antiporter NhaA [Sphingomonas sp.]|uniref:Na+/H+ antiporter NhaA n=1 Tax=Sphingomonas sp. TaxID=28214 RepID=UPI003B3A894C